MSLEALVGAGPVHMVGIGGAGMSALARILVDRGVAVTGSDMKEGRSTAALRAAGCVVAIGHDAANLGGARAVVVNSAIRPTNPEWIAATQRGLPVLHRAQMLALLMKGKRGIAVSGTHGKTTTTSMIALILHRAGIDPSFVVGGDLNEKGSNGHAGAGEWFVAEADESDGSFLWLAPEIAAITNVEADHLDHYGDEGSVRAAFAAFASNVLPGGTVVVSSEDEGTAAIRPSIPGAVVSTGISAGDWTAHRTVLADGSQRMVVENDGAEVCQVHLAVPGEHNARNALMALAVATLAGVDPVAAGDALGSFEGVMRRFQSRGTVGGVSVVDDYAHHPTEVQAILSAAREGRDGRLMVVFQPHLYSRTRIFADGFGRALAAADQVVITDIYGAREDPEPGVTGKLVVDAVLRARPRASVAYLPKRGDIGTFMASRARAGDLVMTIGAGDITMVGDDILAALEARA